MQFISLAAVQMQQDAALDVRDIEDILDGVFPSPDLDVAGGDCIGYGCGSDFSGCSNNDCIGNFVCAMNVCTNNDCIGYHCGTNACGSNDCIGFGCPTNFTAPELPGYGW